MSLNTTKRLITASLMLAAAAALGIAVFYALLSWQALDPKQIEWLLRDDLAQHAFGWLYFKATPWSYPLGQIRGYMEPFGSSLAFTDSFPWFAVSARLVANVLPFEGQVTGAWLLLCFGMQGVFGCLLLRELGLGRRLAVVGSLFFSASPALIHRLDHGHATLCAHWFLVAALFLAIRGKQRGVGLGLSAAWTLVVALAATTHPYLLAMIIPLFLASFAEAFWHAERRARRRLLGTVGAVLVVAIGCLDAFGYFRGSPSSWQGLDYFSSDVFALLNPRNRSALLPGVLKAGQYEGFAWLGSGLLLLGLAALYGSWRSGHPRQGDVKGVKAPLFSRWLLWTCLAMFVYSWGTNVRFFGQWLLDFKWLFAAIGPITNALRVPGRFVWPFYYLAIGWILGTVSRQQRGQRPRLLGALFAVALLLQWLDQRPFFAKTYERLHPAMAVTLTSPAWFQLSRFQHLALIPPLLDDARCDTLIPNDPPYPAHYVHPFFAVAWAQGLTINSGYNPRAPLKDFEAGCAHVLADLAAGNVDPATAYVVKASYLGHWRQWLGGVTNCELVDGLGLCTVSAEPR